MLKKKEQSPIPALISVFFPLTSDAQKREAAAVNDYFTECNELGRQVLAVVQSSVR